MASSTGTGISGGSEYTSQIDETAYKQATLAYQQASLEYQYWYAKNVAIPSMENQRKYQEALIKMQEAELAWAKEKFALEQKRSAYEFDVQSGVGMGQQQFDVTEAFNEWQQEAKNEAERGSLVGAYRRTSSAPTLPYHYELAQLKRDYLARYGKEISEEEIDRLLPWYSKSVKSGAVAKAPTTTTATPGTRKEEPTTIPTEPTEPTYTDPDWEPDGGWARVTTALLHIINPEWKAANYKWEPDPKWGWPSDWRKRFESWVAAGGVPESIPKDQLPEKWWEQLGVTSRAADYANWKAPYNWKEKYNELYPNAGVKPDDPNWTPPSDWNWPSDWKDRIAKGAVGTGYKAYDPTKATAAAPTTTPSVTTGTTGGETSTVGPAQSQTVAQPWQSAVLYGQRTSPSTASMASTASITSTATPTTSGNTSSYTSGQPKTQEEWLEWIESQREKPSWQTIMAAGG